MLLSFRLVILLSVSCSAFTLPAGIGASGKPACRLPSQALAAGRCGSAVNMNLGDRFLRLVRANFNQVLSRFEDPEKVLEQAVIDMQKDLVKVRQAYAEVSASSKRMQQQCRLAESEAAKWYERAQHALEKGQDELAREALSRRQQQVETSNSLKEQVKIQSVSIMSLFESMKDLEAKASHDFSGHSRGFQPPPHPFHSSTRMVSGRSRTASPFPPNPCPSHRSPPSSLLRECCTQMAEAKAKKDQVIARARTAKAATKVESPMLRVCIAAIMVAQPTHPTPPVPSHPTPVHNHCR